MAVPPYSYRYFAGSIATTAEMPLQAVPMGHRFVVAHAAFNSVGASGGILVFYLYPGRIELARLTATTQGLGYFQEFRLVLHEGENLQLRAINATMQGSLSGYFLTGAGGPTFPAALPA